MASQTPTTRQPVLAGGHVPAPPTESEPLLGRPGDAVQKPDDAMIRNLWLGTGWLAQVGGVLLVALVWSGVFTHPLLPLFSPHPLLQSAGVLALLQAVLVLQPTATPDAKRLGQRAHAALNLLSFLLFAAGIVMIETNKFVHAGKHLYTAHGVLGCAAAAALLAQYTFGLLMWGLPGVLGGVDKAKALWKYHRWTGYALWLLLLATVVSAAWTPYNLGVLGIKAWGLGIAAGLVVIGMYPRIQLMKLGIHRA